MKNKNSIYTIEELANMKKAFDDRTANLKDEIAATQAKINQLSEEMDAAADAGDVQKYKELYAQYNDLETENIANKSILERSVKNNLRGFSDDDVMAAWENYIDKYNSSKQKMLNALDDMKKQMADQYMKIAKSQNEAMKIRDTACKLLSTFNTGNVYANSSKFSEIDSLPDHMINISDCYNYAEKKFIEYCGLMASDMDYDRCMELFGKSND